MKIQVIEANSNRPLANTKIQLQVKGKDAGFLSLTSDATGHITLDEKLSGQQICATNSVAAGSDTSKAQWIAAADGARLTLASTVRTTETTGGRSTK
jgi:hypothetical protein